jgi:hypothetical protein
MASPEWFGERWRATGPPPHPPIQPTRGEEKGTERGWRKSTLALPHEMIARVRYVSNEKAGFLFTFLEMTGYECAR